MADCRWIIPIPHYRPDDSLVLVAGLTRHLDDVDDQRAVVRHIALDAATSGMQTAGELIDHIASATPPERKVMIDQARAELGLPSTTDIEAQEAFVRSTFGRDKQLVRDGRWVGDDDD